MEFVLIYGENWQKYVHEIDRLIRANSETGHIWRTLISQ